MSLDQDLMEALRRLYHMLKAYAGNVRDELEVLNYMKNFGIGIAHADFWIRICKILQKQCCFVKVVQTIMRIKSKGSIENRIQIEQFERTLLSDMRSTVYSQFRGKRSASEFGIQKSASKRMVGNIQITESNVQENNDKLKSYAKLIESQMSQLCRLQRQQYQRSQMGKPLSFIATKDENLLKLTRQLFYAIRSPDYVDTSDDESFQLQQNPMSAILSLNTRSGSVQIEQQQRYEDKLGIRNNIESATGELKDNAFIEYSDLNDSLKQKKEELPTKFDFELGFIIQQIQRETHVETISNKSEQAQDNQKKDSANEYQKTQMQSIEEDTIPYKTEYNQSTEQIQELIDLIESEHKRQSRLTQNNPVNQGNTVQDSFLLEVKQYKQPKMSGNKRDQIAKFKTES